MSRHMFTSIYGRATVPYRLRSLGYGFLRLSLFRTSYEKIFASEENGERVLKHLIYRHKRRFIKCNLYKIEITDTWSAR